MLKSRLKLRIAEYETRIGRKVEYQEVAQMLGVTRQQLSNWIHDRAWPRMDMAFRVADKLGCKVDDLYEYEE